ncbi:GntR family transcriptional regulator [Micromonospora sp. DR5-3]|uniref:GntR family transcriptional regulator n=1 Tax=unclassified Micromonospora TaxID=2617518 RepID=UPI001651E42E|nr:MULTISPECIES: GntR family transcriptional regulator [unclassified Micromonospora]MCW3818962.1 GntR family transcriptional regulator [Micromonospora sp. DR5-3]
MIRPLAITRFTVVDQMVDALRGMILTGEIRQGGSLHEADLAASFGVARSTVREVLRQLAGEGLVSFAPGRGAEVRNLSRQDAMDAFAARRALESYAARTIAALSESDRESALEPVATALAAFDSAAERHDPSALADAHMDFHLAVVAALGSPRLTAFARSVHHDLRLWMMAIDCEKDDAPEQVACHRRLLELLCTATPDAAEKAVRDHISDGTQAAATVLKQNTAADLVD